MQTDRQTDAVMRRKKYDLIRMSETCLCGGLKWKGHSFCRRCLHNLSQTHRAALFTTDPIRFPDAYDSAARALIERRVQHG